MWPDKGSKVHFFCKQYSNESIPFIVWRASGSKNSFGHPCDKTSASTGKFVVSMRMLLYWKFLLYCQLWARSADWFRKDRFKIEFREVWTKRSVCVSSIRLFLFHLLQLYICRTNVHLWNATVVLVVQEAFRTDHWALIGRERQVQSRLGVVWHYHFLSPTNCFYKQLSSVGVVFQHNTRFFSYLSCFTGIFKHFSLPEGIWKCFFLKRGNAKRNCNYRMSEGSLSIVSIWFCGNLIIWKIFLYICAISQNN